MLLFVTWMGFFSTNISSCTFMICVLFCRYISMKAFTKRKENYPNSPLNQMHVLPNTFGEFQHFPASNLSHLLLLAMTVVQKTISWVIRSSI